MSATMQQPQAPPQPPPAGGADPIQALIQALQGNPLLEIFQAILQDDPELARKIAVLAQTPERGGMQAVLALLGEVQSKMQAQQGGQPPADPAQQPPTDPGQQPNPAPQQPQGRMDGPPPPDPAQQGAMVPAQPQQMAPQPMQGPANAHPASMQTLLADLPPELSRIVRELNPDQQHKVLGLYEQQGLQPVVQLLTQLQQARAQHEGQVAPQQAMPGPETPKPKDVKPEKKKRDKSVPNFELDPLPRNKWGEKGPSYATCNRHLNKAKVLWETRDTRITEDVALYNLSRQGISDLPVGPRPMKAYNSAEGDIIHVSSRPFQFVERVTSYCTPTGDKKPMTDCPPWADDDDTINASQALEDWLNFGRDQDEQMWFRKGANGDPRMPLPRVEAGGMALMGGAGFQVKFDPRSKQRPIKLEYIPINRLYPLPGVAMMYSETMPLHEARSAWPEINDYYEKYDNTDMAPDEKMQVTVGAWTDVYDEGQGGLWHGIFWATKGSTANGGWGDEAEDKRAKWIKPMTRIDFGFSPYQYVIWGGAPYYATEGVTDYERFRGMGCLTALRRTFKLMDLLWSATATGALKAVDPALVQYYLPGTAKKDMVRYRSGPGQTNYAIVGEKVEPLLWTVAGNPDGQAILNALWQEVSDMDSPLLKGMGSAQSGVQQSAQASAAGSVAVNPIIDALERMYQLQNTLRIELLIRKGGEGELGKLPYPSRPVDDQFDAIWPTFKTLTPKMAELNGTQSVVTIKRVTLMEEQMLWNMLGQAVNSKMLNARDAMKRMGVTNPQRNLLRILQESAVMDQGALKAMMGAAIMGGGNELFKVGWQQVLMAQAQGGPGGSPQAAPTGIPSAAAPTGGPQGAQPSPQPPVM